MTLQHQIYWCLAQTQVNCEAQAKTNLENQNYEVFLPQYKKYITHARKKSLVIRPLFPRYVFVKIDFTNQQWRNIRSTRGISTIIMSGEQPSKVPENIIDRLKVKLDIDGTYKFMTPEFKVGDKVQITDGAFELSLGLVESVKDEHRVILLLNLLERQVRVSIDKNMIAKV